MLEADQTRLISHCTSMEHCCKKLSEDLTEMRTKWEATRQENMQLNHELEYLQLNMQVGWLSPGKICFFLGRNLVHLSEVMEDLRCCAYYQIVSPQLSAIAKPEMALSSTPCNRKILSNFAPSNMHAGTEPGFEHLIAQPIL